MPVPVALLKHLRKTAPLYNTPLLHPCLILWGRDVVYNIRSILDSAFFAEFISFFSSFFALFFVSSHCTPITHSDPTPHAFSQVNPLSSSHVHVHAHVYTSHSGSVPPPYQVHPLTIQKTHAFRSDHPGSVPGSELSTSLTSVRLSMGQPIQFNVSADSVQRVSRSTIGLTQKSTDQPLV